MSQHKLCKPNKIAFNSKTFMWAISVSNQRTPGCVCQPCSKASVNNSKTGSDLLIIFGWSRFDNHQYISSFPSDESHISCSKSPLALLMALILSLSNALQCAPPYSTPGVQAIIKPINPTTSLIFIHVISRTAEAKSWNPRNVNKVTGINWDFSSYSKAPVFQHIR